MDTNPCIKTSEGGLDSESSPQHGFQFYVLAPGQEQPKYHRNNQSEIPRQFNHIILISTASNPKFVLNLTLIQSVFSFSPSSCV